ncbi:MAG: hypothetical protein ACRCYQ_08955 [Nocardioides sp.]
MRQPVQHFTTWHHLRRIRAKAAAGADTRSPVHSAKYERTCTQQDIDEWLAAGPTTRSAIKTFFVIAKKMRLNTTVTVQHRSAKTSPLLSQDQRLAWVRELLTGSSESLPYRVAGMLLLLYAQPLVKVVTLRTSVVDDAGTGMSISLGSRPTDVPEPFASLASISPRGQTCEQAPGPTAPGSFIALLPAMGMIGVLTSREPRSPRIGAKGRAGADDRGPFDIADDGPVEVRRDAVAVRVSASG